MKREKATFSELKLVARDVRPDGRRRVALGKALADLADVSFDVYRDGQGRIILDPQVSIPASEAWLYRNPGALNSVRRGLAEALEGGTKVRSFARFAGVGDES